MASPAGGLRRAIGRLARRALPRARNWLRRHPRLRFLAIRTVRSVPLLEKHIVELLLGGAGVEAARAIVPLRIEPDPAALLAWQRLLGIAEDQP